MNLLSTIVTHAIAALFTITWMKKSENKRNRTLYIALMVTGFLWSQLQTEYLIWRINRKIDRVG
ncbi:hypothetical protein [Halalkalibacter nanhaiisediminis]|uniref:hypothetical protein n=1 Tax=Halalkalibacter nanhaiisediminis TaxID=688079 RepID=UPI0011A4BB9D|nr:hypothetical protein [Halalkalibacter nanhaiisediminis]